MNYSQLPQLAEWIRLVAVSLAAVGTAVGIPILIYQLRLARKNTAASAVANAFSELRELHKVFIEHPEMRGIFYDNAKIESIEKEKHYLALAIAEQFLDSFVHIFMLQNLTAPRFRKARDRYIRAMCKSSQFLTEYLNANSLYLDHNRLRAIVRKVAGEPKNLPT